MHSVRAGVHIYFLYILWWDTKDAELVGLISVLLINDKIKGWHLNDCDKQTKYDLYFLFWIEPVLRKLGLIYIT